MIVITKIIITKQYQLQIKLIDSNQKEIKIDLFNDQSQDYYNPSISFENNIIKFFEETQQSICFLKEWIEHPEVYKEFEIIFQNKNYSLLPEVFFALTINNFKNNIEKQFIIENTLLQ